MNEIFLLVRAKKNKNIKTKPDICEYIAFTDNHLIALLWAYHGEYKKNTENFYMRIPSYQPERLNPETQKGCDSLNSTNK